MTKLCGEEWPGTSRDLSNGANGQSQCLFQNGTTDMNITNLTFILSPSSNLLLSLSPIHSSTQTKNEADELSSLSIYSIIIIII